jgi:hypothetical protein
MIWLYLLLVLLGVVLTVLLARRHSRHVWTAGAATVLAVFSVLSGFSIGIYVAPIALLLLVLAAPHARHRERYDHGLM